MPTAEVKDFKEAQDSLVTLIPFEKPPTGEKLEQSHAAEIISLLESEKINTMQEGEVVHFSQQQNPSIAAPIISRLGVAMGD